MNPYNYFFNVFCITITLTFAPLIANAESSSIVVTDSEKDIEIHLSTLIEHEMKLQSNLKVAKQNPENLYIEVRFDKNDKANSPQIVVLIDTTILSRNKESAPISQVISIVSSANLEINTVENRTAILNWANDWNSKMLPIRVYENGGKLFVAATLVTTTITPLSEKRFISSFLSTVQIWPVLKNDLKKHGLL